MKFIKFIVIVFLVAGIWSCSLEKRVAKYIKAHPGYSITDTVYRHDTLRIAGAKANTSFLFSSRKDTVVIDKGRLQLRYFYSHDTVFLSGHCKDSVIIRQVPIQVNNYKPEVKEVGWKWYWSVIGILVALIGGFVVAKNKFLN